MSDAIPCSDARTERDYVAAIVQLACAPLPPAEATDPLELADCAWTKNRTALGAVYALQEAKRPVNRVTLAEYGIERAEIDELFTREIDCWSHASMAEHLRSLAVLRRTREAHMRGAASAEVGQLEDAREQALVAIEAADGVRRQETFSLHESAQRACGELLMGRSTPQMRTGFPLVDSAIGGLRNRTMTVLGGVTGAGKSSLALAIAFNVFKNHGKRAGFVSCEDAAEIMMPRALSIVDAIDPDDFERPITREFVDALTRAVERCKDHGLFFAYPLNAPLHAVLGAMRRLVQRDKCALLVVDYVQAIMLPNRNSRHIEISAAAQRIKACAQELGVPLILCSQLSRPPKDKPFREPHASELKESGDLENMAEAIWLLWKSSDTDTARVYGKVAKVKWSSKRPRFELLRNPSSGEIVGLGRIEEPQRRDERAGGFD